MKIAVIGANRGIGLALVEELVARGDEVYAFCRQTSDSLNNSGAKKIFSDFEVTNQSKMQSILNNSGISDLDQVYHVSGIMRSTTLDDFNIDLITEQFMVNAVAPILSVKSFLPVLASDAKIGLVTSRMGSITDNTSGGAYGYRMSKSALNAAGKSLSEDLKGQGKSVFLLHPGWVKTDMTNQNGLIDTKESALGMMKIMNQKSLEDTGTFWHTNGDHLPW